MSTRNKSLVSLLLLIPVPSLGVLAGMVWLPDTSIGQLLFGLSKIWLFGLPAAWYLLIERGRFSLSPARCGGFGFAVGSGLLISGVILAAYLLLGEQFLDRRFLAEKITELGLDRPAVYVGAALYWICVNSVLEEYVWRWFVVRQCQNLVGPLAAVVISAMLFTLHHVFAMKVYMPWLTVILCSVGIFIGGATWSWMYVRYKSVWPGYISHAIVDLCIFAIGYSIIFL